MGLRMRLVSECADVRYKGQGGESGSWEVRNSGSRVKLRPEAVGELENKWLALESDWSLRSREDAHLLKLHIHS